jgi:predicted metal-dependent peptidase
MGGIGRDLIQRGGPITQDQKRQMEAEMRVAVAQAAQVAKMQGKMPGTIGKWVADMIESQVPWYEKLERYMTSFAKSESTWAKKNRRYKQYLPWVGKTPKMGGIAIQIDVSGSISKQELDHYAGHMIRIIEQCSPEKVHVLYVDTQVQKHMEFVPAQGDEVKLEFYSGGGTDMENGFRYIDEKIDDVEVIVCLTDGYTSFTQSPTHIPIVWCVSTNVVPTYGEHVPFSIVTE